MFANQSHVPFQQVDGLLDKEVIWLKDARVRHLIGGIGNRVPSRTESFIRFRFTQ